ncbi:MAG TPA: IS4 family transposase [Bacteroidota bacterium]|jgi:hypothetical protein|nr:IS4 family transposase [Bacteroidota bacterium]
MNFGRTVFSQVLDYLPEHMFRRAVARYHGDRRVRRFSCWQQFLCMAFAQLTYRESLRDIEACSRSLGSALYHNGLTADVPHSTLADANKNRPWQIYRDLALDLIEQARVLYRDDKLALAEFDGVIYAFDATIIELCLTLFPWAKANVYQRTRAGIKLHTLYAVQAQLPVYVQVTAANVNETRMIEQLNIESGAYYIFDRGLINLSQLRRIDQQAAYFVIRAKESLRYHRVYSRPSNKLEGIRVDQNIVLDVPRSRRQYPDLLRRIRFFDTQQQRSLIFLTNNFTLQALTIADLYKSRWQIELFFRWIKQHLRIKSFYGTSPNAVHTQIWIAITVYVLIAILKKRLHLDKTSLYTILQILSITLFQKEPIYEVLTATHYHLATPCPSNQLKLFDF